MKNFTELFATARKMYNDAIENTSFDASKSIYVYDFDEQMIAEDGFFSATNGWDSDSYNNACETITHEYYPSECKLIATFNEGETVRCFVYHNTKNDMLLLAILFNEDSWG